MIWEDVKKNKTALILIAVYFGFMELVLHNGCPMVVLTGFPCPACGLTRAGIHFLKGEWIQAWNLNLFIFPIAAFALTAVIKRYFQQESLDFMKKYVIILIAAMTAYYIYRMMTQFPGNPPMSYYYDNLFVKCYSRFWE